MAVDRTITCIPFNINIKGYWLVRDMTNSISCGKCAFSGEDVACPTLYMDKGQTEEDIEESGVYPNAPEFESTREYSLCMMFGDTVSAYFVKTQPGELTD
jgi:hypothetical protein